MEHIYLYGDIFPDDGEFAEMFGTVSLSTVAAQLRQVQGDDVTVHIRSGGGSVMEGFAIYDHLVMSGKNITTLAEGVCASIATVIFLAGKQRKISENCEFLIHNPMGIGIGTADELEEAAEEVRKAEDKILDFYVEKTGSDREVLKSYMAEDKLIDANAAKTLGFATEIVKTINAQLTKNFLVAQLNNSNMATLTERINAMIDKIKAQFTPEKEPEQKEVTNLQLLTADPDKKLDIKANGEPQKGDAVSLVGGGEVNGEHLMPDGSKFIVTNGILTDIILPEPPAEPNPELVELEAKLSEKESVIAQITDEKNQLSIKIAEMEAEQTEVVNKMTELETKLEELSKVKSNYVPPVKEEQFKTEPPVKSEAEKIKEMRANRNK